MHGEYEHDELESDDWEMTPLDQTQVCDRILGLTSFLWRTFLEMYLQSESMPADEVEQRYEGLTQWMAKEGLAKHLSEREKAMMDKPLGKWDQSETFESVWRMEALVTLLWAVGQLDQMPAWSEPADGQLLFDKARLMYETNPLYETSKLRDRAEIEKMHEVSEFWHWRCRHEMMWRQGVQPPPGQTYEMAAASAAESALELGVVTEIIKGDVALNGTAYHDLPDEQWSNLGSTSFERHYGFNWLSGYAENQNWDETRTDT